MLREVLRLLGVDLDRKLAEIRKQIEEFGLRTTHQISERVKETGLMLGFALIALFAPALWHKFDVYSAAKSFSEQILR